MVRFDLTNEELKIMYEVKEKIKENEITEAIFWWMLEECEKRGIEADNVDIYWTLSYRMTEAFNLMKNAVEAEVRHSEIVKNIRANEKRMKILKETGIILSEIDDRFI